MRGRPIRKKPIETDSVYKSRVITRVINRVMKDGKKSLAQKLVYKTLDNLSESKKESRQIFEQAIKNVMPKQEVRSRRIGGATYQVPVPLKHDRSETLAIRWIVSAAKNKKGKPMTKKLTEEIKNAYNNTGGAVKKKEDTHKMAEANKAFAHFRW